MKKKLAVLIAAAILITSMPFYAFAGDETGTDAENQLVSTGTVEETAPAPATNQVIMVNGKLCYYNAAG